MINTKRPLFFKHHEVSLMKVGDGRWGERSVSALDTAKTPAPMSGFTSYTACLKVQTQKHGSVCFLCLFPTLCHHHCQSQECNVKETKDMRENIQPFPNQHVLELQSCVLHFLHQVLTEKRNPSMEVWLQARDRIRRWQAENENSFPP